MQIFSAAQIQLWDQFTIGNEPVTSTDLMERAAKACFRWLMENDYENRSFSIFCGKGNNGGDGLVIARMLADRGHHVILYILEFGHKGTGDFQLNLARLHNTTVTIRFIPAVQNIHPVDTGDVIIDAIFGSGLNRKPEGLNADVIQHINRSGCEIIAIDIPSGVSADNSSADHTKVKVRHTLSFEQYKLAFMMPENEEACGEVHILSIGLHPDFKAQTKSGIELTEASFVKSIYKPRNNFAHKGTYGHTLLIAGSYGKMGAAVLATTACLRSGTGLCTVHVPGCGYEIMQVAAPEAMTETDAEENYNTRLNDDTEKYTSIGIGPGIGKNERTADLLKEIINTYKKPIVVDADGLNLLSENPVLLEQLPPGSILTPHPKEFERLFGKSANDFERMKLAATKAASLKIVIVLKGHRTLIATPEKIYFNSTGNAGMASGGTGDSLTGIIAGLLAQKYSPADAAVIGVYLHGLAGDIAAKEISMESLIASDLIHYLGKAFLSLSS